MGKEALPEDADLSSRLHEISRRIELFEKGRMKAGPDAKPLRRTLGEMNALSALNTVKLTQRKKSKEPCAPMLKSPTQEAARVARRPKVNAVSSRFEFTGSPNPQLSGTLVHGVQDPVIA